MSNGNEVAIPSIQFQTKDFIEAASTWEDGVQFSKWDKDVFYRWDDKMRNSKVFLHPLDSIVKSVPPNNKKYYAVMCPSRVSKKRPPSSFTNVREPFDAERFNFTKVAADEMMYKIRSVEGVNANLIINNAPYVS